MLLSFRIFFQGLNFSILADGAWGGYFKTMLREKGGDTNSRKFDYVPFCPLTDYVRHQYEHIQLADTITIDPHKSGFCPYPGGALCYRNGTMRALIAVMHPEVYHGEDDPTMGVYGVEGSKPGAAPTGIYLAHNVSMKKTEILINIPILVLMLAASPCLCSCNNFYPHNAHRHPHQAYPIDIMLIFLLLLHLHLLFITLCPLRVFIIIVAMLVSPFFILLVYHHHQRLNPKTLIKQSRFFSLRIHSPRIVCG